MADISSKLQNLNPFGKGSGKGGDEDDQGGAIGKDSVGGGGRHSIRADKAGDDLRVSHALRSFLVDRQVLSEEDADLGKESLDKHSPALDNLLKNGDFVAPAELTDRSHPLPEYFVSSSHNTYLMAHQLYGKSSAEAYETAIRTGSRCVEIDAWDGDNKDEPKVTHGYTLVSHIPFRAVCETIRDMCDEEAKLAAQNPGHSPTPILLSLENHCDEHGQKRLAEIMIEVFGDRLLSKPVRDEGHAEQAGYSEHVRLNELGAKVAVIVEHHLPDEKEDSESSSDSDTDDEDEKKARKEYQEKKKEETTSIIIPELAALGVYAQSVKPRDNSWFDPGELRNAPHHHLINVSESGLAAHLPAKADMIAKHNSKHLMRVYPKGTRINSSNLRPLPFWAIGAQVCALNWQTFGANNQLNDALFAGSDGFLLKPEALRLGGTGIISSGKMKRLRLHVAGATEVPLHSSREAHTLKPYLTCTLHSPLNQDDVPKRKTSPYKHHKLGFMHHGENPKATDPIWDETLEWDYEDNELVFVRMLVKSDDSWAKNPIFAISAFRLSYATPGWTFVRMLDLQGRETKCTLLLNVEVLDI